MFVWWYRCESRETHFHQPSRGTPDGFHSGPSGVGSSASSAAFDSTFKPELEKLLVLIASAPASPWSSDLVYHQFNPAWNKSKLSLRENPLPRHNVRLNATDSNQLNGKKALNSFSVSANSPTHLHMISQPKPGLKRSESWREPKWSPFPLESLPVPFQTLCLSKWKMELLGRFRFFFPPKPSTLIGRRVMKYEMNIIYDLLRGIRRSRANWGWRWWLWRLSFYDSGVSGLPCCFHFSSSCWIRSLLDSFPRKR